MQFKYIAGSLLLAGALGFLVVSSLQASSFKSIPVADLRAADAKPANFVGQRLRVVGFVGDKPVQKQPSQTANGIVNIAHFEVVEGKVKCAVSYSDALPDTFRAGGPVQIDGTYIAPGVIKADHVLTKCPSKYQEGEGAVKGQETGAAVTKVSAAVQ